MTNNMKKYLLEHGVHPRNDFAKAVGIETPSTLDALLFKVQTYIQYEEKKMVNIARDSRHQESENSSISENPSKSRRRRDKKK